MEDTQKLLESIISKLDQMDKRLVDLETTLEDMKQDTSKMTSHISFIENIYERIQVPFNTIMDSVATLPRRIL